MKTPEEVAADLLLTTNKYLTEISQITGLSRNKIRAIRKRLGLHRQASPEQVCIYEDELRRRDEAVEAVRSGVPMRQAIKMTTGLAYSGFYQACRRRGVIAPRVECGVFIYGLACPVSRQVFYVGASKNPWARYYRHIAKPVSIAMAGWLAALKRIKKAPKLKILDFRITNRPRPLEVEWIRSLHAAGHPLMNQELR